MSTSAPEYPKWVHRPAGVTAWKDERCAKCRRPIDSATEDTFTLWTTLLLADARNTFCGTCAKEATR